MLARGPAGPAAGLPVQSRGILQRTDNSVMTRSPAITLLFYLVSLMRV